MPPWNRAGRRVPFTARNVGKSRPPFAGSYFHWERSGYERGDDWERGIGVLIIALACGGRPFIPLGLQAVNAFSIGTSAALGVLWTSKSFATGVHLFEHKSVIGVYNVQWLTEETRPSPKAHPR